MQANKLAISLKRTSTQDTACTTHPAWQPPSSPNLLSTHPPTHALSCLPRTSSFLLVYLQLPKNTIKLFATPSCSSSSSSSSCSCCSCWCLYFVPFCLPIVPFCSIVCLRRMNAVCFECAFFLSFFCGKFGLCWRYVSNKSAQWSWESTLGSQAACTHTHTHTLLLFLCSATKGQAALPPICILFSLQFNVFHPNLGISIKFNICRLNSIPFKLHAMQCHSIFCIWNET